MSGLAALAQAAMFCCDNDGPSTSSQPLPPVNAASSTDAAPRESKRSCCSSGANSRPPSPKPKRAKRSSTHGHRNESQDGPSASYVESILSSTPSTSYPAVALAPPPLFPPVASLGAVTSTEDTCCCGTQCSCPGCSVHRGADNVSHSHKDCTEGECATCVNNDGGVALPERTLAYSQGGFASSTFAPSASTSAAASASAAFSPPPPAQPSPALPHARARGSSVSCIDAFFATAAALPAPPPGRTRALDPTDTRTYPRGVARSLFGLVEVPKLQCNCPGGCGCPEGQCACGDGCTGCAPGHVDEDEEGPAAEQGVRDREGGEVVVPREVRPAGCGGCCG